MEKRRTAATHCINVGWNSFRFSTADGRIRRRTPASAQRLGQRPSIRCVEACAGVSERMPGVLPATARKVSTTQRSRSGAAKSRSGVPTSRHRISRMWNGSHATRRVAKCAESAARYRAGSILRTNAAARMSAMCLNCLERSRHTRTRAFQAGTSVSIQIWNASRKRHLRLRHSTRQTHGPASIRMGSGTHPTGIRRCRHLVVRLLRTPFRNSHRRKDWHENAPLWRVARSGNASARTLLE